MYILYCTTVYRYLHYLNCFILYAVNLSSSTGLWSKTLEISICGDYRCNYLYQFSHLMGLFLLWNRAGVYVLYLDLFVCSLVSCWVFPVTAFGRIDGLHFVTFEVMNIVKSWTCRTCCSCSRQSFKATNVLLLVSWNSSCSALDFLCNVTFICFPLKLHFAWSQFLHCMCRCDVLKHNLYWCRAFVLRRSHKGQRASGRPPPRSTLGL